MIVLLLVGKDHAQRSKFRKKLKIVLQINQAQGRDLCYRRRADTGIQV